MSSCTWPRRIGPIAEQLLEDAGDLLVGNLGISRIVAPARRREQALTAGQRPGARAIRRRRARRCGGIGGGRDHRRATWRAPGPCDCAAERSGASGDQVKRKSGRLSCGREQDVPEKGHGRYAETGRREPCYELGTCSATISSPRLCSESAGWSAPTARPLRAASAGSPALQLVSPVAGYYFKSFSHIMMWGRPHLFPAPRARGYSRASDSRPLRQVPPVHQGARDPGGRPVSVLQADLGVRGHRGRHRRPEADHAGLEQLPRPDPPSQGPRGRQPGPRRGTARAAPAAGS